MMQEILCPYPGLRPFNEEESIFFKGREEHVEKIISLLEKNKFLMLTGASGDGKSSLVYAGLIPNARAGFFKAKYNNWLVADFRPERTPLTNFAKAIAIQLKLDAAYVEKELSYGFSSLVNLYRSSSFYVDEKNSTFINLDANQQKIEKKKAANLLVLVDQFEEFFTNPENYSEGKTTIQAQTVVNILLETSKIALESDLPIYLVCTMRSDYVGQCAAFRNLPEYIGFSQFFVPRLKRKELHQVIEEPAILSGQKIANRLTETLINQLSNGFDQLPVLQHALSQIWKLTPPGQAMDLIQLAEIAGISKKVLSEEDQIKFESHFQSLPDYKRKFFGKPTLNNVLNAHINELYEQAADYYNSKYKKNISKEEAQWVIKIVFQCLTKTDNSRAVRNRMTLGEITALINKTHIGSQEVAGILELFRLQGNTFLKPFIAENEIPLNEEDVLDITHESLIRNWDLLKKWVEEEDSNRQLFLDFQKQLQRWTSSNKSDNFLLSAGSLSYFENWYRKFKPNKYWLMKYDESAQQADHKNKIAEDTIVQAEAFIKRSGQQIRKKRRSLMITVILTIGFLSAFTVWALVERKNALIQQQIALQKTQQANESQKLALIAKNKAVSLKDMAEKSKHQALSAKDAALKARQEALLAKNIAEIERLKAEEQAIIAEQQTNQAEEQRKIASSARDVAVAAEKKAKKLTLISLAQSLALKSKTIEEDKQLRALLALQAYNLTVLNGENPQNPIIYEALRSSYSLISNKQGYFDNLPYEVRSIAPMLSESQVLIAGKKDRIDLIDINQKKVLKTYTIPEQKTIFQSQLSNNGLRLLQVYEDGSMDLWELLNGNDLKKIDCGIIGKSVKSAQFSNSGKKLVCLSKDNKLNLFNIESNQLKSDVELAVNHQVKTMAISENKNWLFYSTESGEINIYNMQTKQVEQLFTSTAAKVNCMNYSDQENILAVGFNDGKIRLFSTTGKGIVVFSDHLAVVENIIFNSKGNLLASSSADKNIKIYDLTKKNEKPLVLKNQQAKARCIAFKGNYGLIAGMADKSIEQFELSSKELANRTCALLKRELSEEEWHYYIGEGLEFEKTCK